MKNAYKNIIILLFILLVISSVSLAVSGIWLNNAASEIIDGLAPGEQELCFTSSVKNLLVEDHRIVAKALAYKNDALEQEFSVNNAILVETIEKLKDGKETLIPANEAYAKGCQDIFTSIRKNNENKLITYIEDLNVIFNRIMLSIEELYNSHILKLVSTTEKNLETRESYIEISENDYISFQSVITRINNCLSYLKETEGKLNGGSGYQEISERLNKLKTKLEEMSSTANTGKNYTIQEANLINSFYLDEISNDLDSIQKNVRIFILTQLKYGIILNDSILNIIGEDDYKAADDELCGLLELMQRNSEDEVRAAVEKVIEDNSRINTIYSLVRNEISRVTENNTDKQYNELEKEYINQISWLSEKENSIRAEINDIKLQKKKVMTKVILSMLPAFLAAVLAGMLLALLLSASFDNPVKRLKMLLSRKNT